MKPTFAASIALLALVAASHAAPPASQPATKPAEFGIGWTGTLKDAVCRTAHYRGFINASLLEVRNADGSSAGTLMLSDHKFINELADHTPVPATYANVKVRISSAANYGRATVFAADVVR